MYISTESILNALPGLVLIKELHQEKARWVWSNDAVAQLAGFKNGDLAIGIYDEEMRCDAAEYASEFLMMDQEVLSGKQLKIIEMYTYADGERHILIGEKKILRDTKTLNAQIIYNGINIPLKDIKSQALYSVFNSDHLSYFVGDGKYGSYSIHDKIDCLTPKETECFFYWIRGYTAKEIANKLYRSHRTIEIHLTNIKSKIGLQKKSQIIEWAVHNKAFTKIPSTIFENG